MDLNNKVAVVTGSARGLGKAIAVHLKEHGAKPVLIDVNGEQLAETKEEIGAAGAYAVNITDEAAVVAAFRQIKDELGSVDVLVNNAGIMRDGLLLKAKDGEIVQEMSFDQFSSVIDVNVKGSFLCGREAAKHMATAGNGGVIVNISSLARSGNMGQSNYAASKAAVVAMTVSWARDLARYGIRTGAVAPGVVYTDMVAQMKEEALDRLRKMIPLNSLGRPEDIAHAVRFIIENDYFTARVIEPDGGLTF